MPTTKEKPKSTKKKTAPKKKAGASTSRKKTQETLTAIHILLDRSGSMGVAWNNTIEGFNKFVREQTKEPGQALLSLTQFDDQYEPNYRNVPIGEAEYLTRDTYTPRGMTALNDAIAKSIGELKDEFGRMKRKPDQVLFVIITDGMENASKEYKGMNNPQLLSLIEDVHENEKWQFVYLGADQDAQQVAHQTGGVPMATSSSGFGGTAAGHTHAWHNVTMATTAYRGSGEKQVDSFFTDEQKASLEATKTANSSHAHTTYTTTLGGAFKKHGEEEEDVS